MILPITIITNNLQVAMDGVIQDVKCLFGSVLNSLQTEINRALKGFGCLSDEQVATVEALLDEAVNPFQGLETHYLQQKFFKEYFNYVVSA